MAKKETKAAASKDAAPKAAPKKEAAKKPAAASAPSELSINTSAAASAAAALIGNKVNLTGTPGSTKPDSAAFKAMKQNLNSHSAGVGNILPQAGAKKSNAPFEKSKQVGHNQTFGADVNRAGVPRRTGGG